MVPGNAKVRCGSPHLQGVVHLCDAFVLWTMTRFCVFCFLVFSLSNRGQKRGLIGAKIRQNNQVFFDVLGVLKSVCFCGF